MSESANQAPQSVAATLAAAETAIKDAEAMVATAPAASAPGETPPAEAAPVTAVPFSNLPHPGDTIVYCGGRRVVAGVQRGAAGDFLLAGGEWLPAASCTAA